MSSTRSVIVKIFCLISLILALFPVYLRAEPGLRGELIKADTDGFLLLRINDLDISSGDNDGSITVSIRTVP